MKVNLWFYNIYVRDQPQYIFEEYLHLVEEVNDYILSYFTTNKELNNGYTVLTKNWKVLDRESSLIFYDSPLKSFENICNIWENGINIQGLPNKLNTCYLIGYFFLKLFVLQESFSSNVPVVHQYTRVSRLQIILINLYIILNSNKTK